MKPIPADEIFLPPPRWLHHYTGQEGLFGILKTGEIWATKVRFMNDYSEFKYGFDMAQNLVLHEPPEGIEDRAIFQDAVVERFRRVPPNVFISSWSEAGNLLSQWRAYSRGSQGYAFRLFGAGLKAAADNAGLLLGRCLYDVGKQRIMVQTIVHKLWEDFGRADKENRKVVAGQLAGMCVRSLLRLSPFMKHPGFEEEQEWRLVSPPTPKNDNRVGVRIGKVCPIPFLRVPLTWAKGSVGEIDVLIGPGAMTYEAADAVSILGRDSKLEVVAKVFSLTPLRDM